MTQAETTIFPEIEITVEGHIEPSERETGPTYDCGGTPGHDAFVDHFEISGMTISGADILAGVDRNNPEVAKLLGNIETAIAAYAVTELMGEYSA